jgi:hypothetical protein
VADLRLSSVLRLAGEAVGLGWDFGLETLEALAWVAQTVQTSVYVSNSFVRTATGFRFALANPPLRIGAFSSIRVLVGDVPVPPERLRVRLTPAGSWRFSSEIGTNEPLELQGGSGTEFDAEWPLDPPSGPVRIRLELHNVAIPPLVWIEFRETPKELPSP